MSDLSSVIGAPALATSRDNRDTRPQRVYLDYHASTPCDPRVVQEMLPYFVEVFGNPSSASHGEGKRADEAVGKAREFVARAIGALPGEIAFTSGATESNNLAILGSFRAAPPKRRRVLASAIEHKAVLEACRALARSGAAFQVIPTDHRGLVDLAALVDLVDDETALVSVQAANNEIGTIQPVSEIAQICHRVGAVFHCDAAQALGRIPIDVADWNVDLLSISSHKCYGPKGVGALFVRGGIRTAPLEPLMYGGGQESQLRPGTLNVPGIVGFGRACELTVAEQESEADRVRHLRDAFEAGILTAVPDVIRNGALGRRLAGNSSLLFRGVDAEAVIANLPQLALSTGSACTSGAPEPSHVLTAIGLSREDAGSTLRIGIGRFTMDHELQYAGSSIADVVQRIRSMAL